MQKNKGFTLVELLIAVAILSVVLVSITSMMVTGSRSFAKGNADAEMQREAQLVVDQIEDMIIDTNGGVDYVASTDKKELVLYNQIPDGAGAYTYTKEVVTWNKADENITYSKYNVEYNDASKTYVETGVISDKEILASGVREFDVDVSDTKDEYNAAGEQITIVQSVQISAEYIGDSGKVAYATTPVVTLRNRMMLAGNPKMIFEEPPYVEPKQLAVDVQTLWHKSYIEGWNDDYTALVPAHHIVKFRSTVTASGFEEGELNYKWTADVPWISFPYGDSNPEECDAWIDTSAWDSHVGTTFAVRLTVTGPGVDPAWDEDVYTIYREASDTSHERGQTSGQAYYSINNPINGDAMSYTISIEDAAGHPYDDQETLASFIKIELDKGGLKFNVEEGLDPTREYFVKVTVQCYNNKTDVYTEIVRTLYIPAVEITGQTATCPWMGFEYNPSQLVEYGGGGTGDGIQYLVEGYLKETWSARNPYKVTLEEWQVDEPDKLPEGAELVINPGTQSKTDSASSNVFRLPFTMDMTNCTSDQKKDIRVRYIKVKITMTEAGYEKVSGYATVVFTD